MTPEQMQKLKDWVAAGLSRHEFMTMAHHAGILTKENQYEIEHVLFFKLKAEAKYERGKVLADAALMDHDAAKFWLTHQGGWAPSKLPEITGINTLDDIERLRALCDAKEAQLLGAKPPEPKKLTSG